MSLYTVQETREIVRRAIVDADNADEAMLLFQRMRISSGKVDIQKHTDECHVIVKEYEEVEK